jgi:hypothetical protein
MSRTHVVQTDPNLEDMNVQERVDDFVAAVNAFYVHNQDTKHIMFNMGSDFQYEVSAATLSVWLYLVLSRHRCAHYRGGGRTQMSGSRTWTSSSRR